MTRRNRYTPGALAFLKDEYRSMKVSDLTAAFNRAFGQKKNECQIKSALKNHHITCGRKPKDRLVNRIRLFTPEQIRFIRDNYAGRSIAEMTDIFNQRFDTSMTHHQIKTFVHNRGITSGRTGFFEKGFTPWNKGTKGQGLTGANKTSFRKGNVPANRKPDGSERIEKDYVMIKVRERNPYAGFPTRYKAKHVHIWEQIHGPVPDGHAVIFKDGDKLNFDPDNLALVSRSELLRLNKHGYKDAPEEIKPSILALARLEVKTFEVQRNER